MVTYTNSDNEIILKVPKNEFEEFNKKFLMILEDFARKPIFHQISHRTTLCTREYQERTNLEYGIFSAVIAACCSMVVWLLPMALFPVTISVLLTWPVVLSVIFGPALFFLFAAPFFVKYEWISWIEVQLGECWYIQIKYPKSLLVERIKNELVKEG